MKLTGPIRKPETHQTTHQELETFTTHIPEISIQDLHISMDNLQSHQLIVRRPDTADKEQRGISSIYNLRIYVACSLASHLDQFWVPIFTHTYPCIQGNYTFLFVEPRQVA